MTIVRLTDSALRALSLPKKGQTTYWDKSTKGFGVRVSQGGTRSFVIMHGMDRRLTTIGRYPTISLADARSEAKRLLAEHVLGKRQPHKISFTEAKDQYLVECSERLRAKTYYDYARVLNTHFKFSRTPLDSISTDDIMRRVNKLAATPAEQNYAFVVARGFFNWCVKRRYIQASPVAALSKPRASQSRERVLNDDEFFEIFATAKAYSYPYGTIIQLLLLTGQRRNEIVHLRWEWVDQAERTITLPREITKNKRTHTFPYGALTASVLEQVPEMSPLLFPARGAPSRVFSGWSKCKQAFDKHLENVEPYTLHDFRRTLSSKFAQLGTPLHVTEKLLNHVSGSISGVSAVYNRYSFMDEMRIAVERYDRFLQKQIEAD